MSNDNSASIVSKVWNYPPSPSGLRRAGAHVLKNVGVGYGDYVEQIRIETTFDRLAEHDRGQ